MVDASERGWGDGWPAVRSDEGGRHADVLPGRRGTARGEHSEARVERRPACRLGVQGRQVSSPAKTAGHEKDEEDSVKGLLVLFIAFGLILIVGSLAFRAEGGATRAALLLLALAMFLMTMVWFGWVNRYLSGVARGTTLGILALVVALIALLPVLYLGEDERIYFLKLAAIVFLSLLPGLLYLQFVVVKGLGLRSEYILALHRLHIDRYENLPTPPVGSLFHRPGSAPAGRRRRELLHPEVRLLLRASDHAARRHGRTGRRQPAARPDRHDRDRDGLDARAAAGVHPGDPPGARRPAARRDTRVAVRGVALRVLGRVLLLPGDAHAPVLPGRPEAQRISQRGDAHPGLGALGDRRQRAVARRAHVRAGERPRVRDRRVPADRHEGDPEPHRASAEAADPEPGARLPVERP